MSTTVSFRFFGRVCFCALVSLTLFGGLPLWVLAFDEPPGESVHTLDTIVVTDTKTPTPLSHSTSAVEVITAEDFKRRNIKTVPEALKLSQGLAVFASGGAGTSTTIRMRGGSADQTLVVVDGAIMNSATLGQFNFAHLTTDNIEKIEILRGAQSMVWGSDAIGGVINITTKRGSGIPKVSGFFEYGSFNSIREGGSLSGQKGPVDLAVTLSRWDMQGFSAINYQRGAEERDAYRNWTASTRLGVSLPKDGRLDFTFRWINGDINFDNSFGPRDVYKTKTTSQRFIYGGTYSQPLMDWWNQKITLTRTDEDSDTQAGAFQRNLITGVVGQPSSFNNSKIDTQTDRVEWQHNFQIGDPILLSMGYQYRENQGENRSSTGFPKKTISSHSGFAQIQLNLWDRLFATGGFRQESNNTFGDSTTYRVTGGYLVKETGTKIRGSYATGFRAPDINELFFPNFGNPDLKAEKSQSMDVGIDQSLFENRLLFSVGYFWNRYRQLITTVFDPVSCGALSTFGFCAQNIGSAKTQGWETSLKLIVARDLPFLKSLDVQGHYTYTLTRDLMTAARLPRWPVHQASAVLSYQPVDPLVMTASFRYVGSRFNTTGNQQPLPDFHVINFSATYDITKNFQGYIRVENILNRNYEEIRFFGTPVRSVFGGVRVQFDLPVGETSS